MNRKLPGSMTPAWIGPTATSCTCLPSSDQNGYGEPSGACVERIGLSHGCPPMRTPQLSCSSRSNACAEAKSAVSAW